ncbi:ImmA/IrrE family metallo-endopeptidase [Flagellimonas algicola]|uniref:ImmA/IrrE family metallo-endopeptidase n=1 Tax=Flagellimonas algicola TaxID=2583815 RepID=A0ABY2WJX1_9FLAO|nr:ImmA/IrrE family metallo-endopeptidase [Allomuricauda algicola]TMU54816.1 ImmA/IrrE family metallo-endopeptidase [Allomuricauda algicola]
MKSIFLSAIKSSAKVRNRLGLNMYEPINIYDTCKHFNVTVRVVNINMEGIYVKADNHNMPTILLSNERPFSRRVFTCAHEFGHHCYGHGSKIDGLDYDRKYSLEQNKEELLVNAFASSLLMPLAGLQKEFAKRKLNPKTANPLNYFVISSYFGVGYHTLVYHCKVNKLINNTKAKELLKYTPAKLLNTFFSANIEKSHFKYLDNHSQPPILDLEVSNYLIAPFEAEVNTHYLKELGTTDLGIVHMACKSGISKVSSPNFSHKIEVRIEPKNYVGLSEYRHLE